MQRLEKHLNNLIKQQFNYTTNKGCLTFEQRKFYQQNGYIIFRKLLKDEDIEQWKVRFLQYCDKKRQPLPGMQIVKDIALVKKNKGKQLKGEASITKIQDFQDDQVLQTFCTNPSIIPILKSFCGDNIKSVHTMFINKPPQMGSTSRHPLHQDLHAFPFGPANKIVAAWASLEDATIENGSLSLIPMSHKGKFYDHDYPEWEGLINKAYFGIKQDQFIKKAQKAHLQMKKGDIIFFHPLLIHGSGQNKSSGYRKSMCCHFAASECQYIDIAGKVQEKVAKEIMSYATKKFPDIIGDFGYNHIFKTKSRLVAGQEFEDKL